MKRFVSKSLSIILAFSILMTLVPQFTARAYTSGDYTYFIDENYAVIYSYTGAGGNISIPATLGGYPVYYIAVSAFENCLSLTGVTLPNTIIGINDRAFNGCEFLESVTMSEGVSHIDAEAFRDCHSLTSITIPNSVEYIDNFVFYRL